MIRYRHHASLGDRALEKTTRAFKQTTIDWMVVNLPTVDTRDWMEPPLESGAIPLTAEALRLREVRAVVVDGWNLATDAQREAFEYLLDGQPTLVLEIHR